MLFKKRNNCHKMYVQKCDVKEDRLTDVIEKLADDTFYLEIAALNKNDKIMDYIAKEGIRFASSDRGDEADVILEVNKKDFREMVEFIVQCDAEVIVFYFPNESVSFDQFLYNAPFVSQPQKGAIIKKLCAIVCTWVANDYELHFDFDPSKYNVEFIRQCF